MKRSKMPTLDDTLALMRRAHAGQVDMAGRPYHEHPERVLSRMLERWPDAMYYEKHAALLHDVLEDTDVSAKELRRLGYSPFDVEIVEALTKPAGDVPYLKWIQLLADSNFISALKVKWADNRDNADPGRLALLPPDKSQFLAERYEAARAILEIPLGDCDKRQIASAESHHQVLQRWYADPPVLLRTSGDTDVNGGPITETGWYADPYCHPMCCRPEGPFATYDLACDWAWTQYEVPEDMRIHTSAAPDA